MSATRYVFTADGSTVTITPRGIEYDLHVRNARGETISTVVMNADDVAALMAEMEEYVDSDAYDEGYQDGYRDGQEAA